MGSLPTALPAMGIRVHVIAMPRAMARLGESSSGQRWSKWFWCGRMLGLFPPDFFIAGVCAADPADCKPDVLHSNGFKMHLLSIWLRLTGTPVLWHIHDFVGSRPSWPVCCRVSRPAVPPQSRIPNTSGRIFARFAGNLPATTVFNAVDLTEFSPLGPCQSGIPYRDFPPAGGVVRIGFVATMARWKGHNGFFSKHCPGFQSHSGSAYIIGDAIYQSDDSQWQVSELRPLAAAPGGCGPRRVLPDL